MDFLLNSIDSWGAGVFGAAWAPGLILLFTVLKIVAIILPLVLCVAYLTLWERKMIAYMHLRIGPNRVGPRGLLQPFADVLKLLMKEITIPHKANRVLFVIAPIMTLAPSLVAWAVIPFSPGVVLAEVNAALLFVLAIASIEVYGIIIAGWASNSKYALLAAMRASAQMISYEIAMGFAIVVVLLVAGSLNLGDIVNKQNQGYFADLGAPLLSWNWLLLLPIFIIYLVSGVAETNRHPFDVVEGESEIVAGHMVEYSGMSFALFFVAEYANMILISLLAALMFWGGWNAPFSALDFIPGWIWLGLKTFLLVSIFIWLRASLPRYRYDQIMRLGWKVFIPFTLMYIVIVAILIKTPFNPWN